MANARKAGIWAAVALFLITLGAGAFVVAWYLWPEGSGDSASTAGRLHSYRSASLAQALWL